MPATQFPLLLAGLTPPASVLGALAPWTDVKPSGQAVTSSTTLVPDNDLQWTAGANTHWWFAVFVSYQGGSGNLKFQWSIPSGTLRGAALYTDTSPALGIHHITASGSQTAVTSGAGTNLPLLMAGSITVGGTGGTVVLQWAQGTPDLTPTAVNSGSGLYAVEIS